MEVRPEKLSLPLERPEMPFVQRPLLDWRARNIIDVAVFMVTIACLAWSGAPTWAYAICVYLSTRSSRLEDAARAAALQSTERVRLEAIEQSVDKLVERIDRALHHGRKIL